MSQSLQQAAIVAIFHRQMSMDRAVRFVTQQTGADESAAGQALREAMTWYRVSR